MRVTRIRLHPVKSFAGYDVASARVLPWGLEGDRRWAVVDPTGQPVTAREHNGLLGLTAESLADGGVLLADSRHHPFTAPTVMPAITWRWKIA